MSKLNEQRMAFAAASNNYRQDGLTKLELFAAMAMQGMCAYPQVNDATRCAGAAVKFAKALLAELEKESKQ